MTEPTQAISTPRAAVHDLGYRRYLGIRRPQHTRWRAVVKNMLRMAWQGYWQTKVWLFGAVTTVVALGMVMAFAVEKASSTEAASSTLSKLLDSSLAQSFTLLPWLAFVLTMTALGRTVSRDLGAGAFEFYFSRPVRAIDYVAGKLGGAVILVGVQLLAAPLLLALFRVGVDWEHIADKWVLIPQTALIGTMATLLFATVPLALSALVVKPRNALILWAIVWFLVGNIARAAAIATDSTWLYAFDPYGLILGVTYGFYGLKQLAFRALPGLGFSITCLSIYIVAAVGTLYFRVRSIERAGIGAR